MTTLLRLFRDDSGHDLIEYALLAATIGIGSAVALSLMPSVMNLVYQSWNGGMQTLWEPCDPGSAASCH